MGQRPLSDFDHEVPRPRSVDQDFRAAVEGLRRSYVDVDAGAFRVNVRGRACPAGSISTISSKKASDCHSRRSTRGDKTPLLDVLFDPGENEDSVAPRNDPEPGLSWKPLDPTSD